MVSLWSHYSPTIVPLWSHYARFSPCGLRFRHYALTMVPLWSHYARFSHYGPTMPSLCHYGLTMVYFTP